MWFSNCYVNTFRLWQRNIILDFVILCICTLKSDYARILCGGGIHNNNMRLQWSVVITELNFMDCLKFKYQTCSLGGNRNLCSMSVCCIMSCMLYVHFVPFLLMQFLSSVFELVVQTIVSDHFTCYMLAIDLLNYMY